MQQPANDDSLSKLADMNKTGRTPRVLSPLPSGIALSIGSDVELSRAVGMELHRKFGEIVHTEGAYWRFAGTHWEPIHDSEMRRAVHVFDGFPYLAQDSETVSIIKLNKSRVDSILNELSFMIYEKEFFKKPSIGINCASGFIRIEKNGFATLLPHDPKHRHRHTLPGHWNENAPARPPEGSLLHKLLEGVFRGDEDVGEKIDLLAEIAGIAALGCATRLAQPRAVILKGETAENGKSQILDLARVLLPPSALSSVSASRMGDERHIIGLVGKLLNASDELTSSNAIASDTFKAVVTGEPVDGRDVYKSRIEFRCVAQHMFSTNVLPVFQGGMDRGIQRRLLVITFNRVIPLEERIENIGERIGEEEPDLLLAWAVAGACRIVQRKNFAIPKSSKIALNEWLYGSDPVLAWVAERVEARPIIGHMMRERTREAYRKFREWSLEEGFGERNLPSINSFTQRVVANAKGIEFRRHAYGRFFYGMEIVLPRESSLDGEP